MLIVSQSLRTEQDTLLSIIKRFVVLTMMQIEANCLYSWHFVVDYNCLDPEAEYLD